MRKKRRHPFLKFLFALILIGCAAAFAYVRYYPGGSTEKLKSGAKQAGHMLKDGAQTIKEALSEEADDEDDGDDAADDAQQSESRLSSTADINLRCTGGYTYAFTYNGEDYTAVYMTDTWKIYDSYKITNKHDMTIICQALSDVYTVPSRDGTSVRTAGDMAYEWQQHNIIYRIAPEGGRTKERTKNVDLDPEDQGKSWKDLYDENMR